MMICNNCGSRVGYDPEMNTWVCNACRTYDPPIQVRPEKPKNDLDLFSIDENVMRIKKVLDSDFKHYLPLDEFREENSEEIDKRKPENDHRDRQFLLRR